MKIISNFKDYYDYLQGIYGIDEKIVYDRVFIPSYVNKHAEKQGLFDPNYLYTKDTINYHILSVCNILYYVVQYNGEYYYHRDSLPEKLKPVVRVKYNQKVYNWVNDDALWAYTNKECYEFLDPKDQFEPTDINDKECCPVILLKSTGDIRHKGYEWEYKNIRLKDFNFHKIMSAHDVYIAISEFLSKEPEIKDSRTNTQKIEGHGFDNVTSFRNPIK